MDNKMASNKMNTPKKLISTFLLVLISASVSQADNIEVTSVRAGAQSGKAKCSYPGEENVFDDEGRELAGGAFAGDIDIEVKNNRVTKLDATITGTSCRVSLGAFRQIEQGNNNMVLKNSDDCSVVISFRSDFVRRADGSSSSSGNPTLRNVVMNFGLVDVAGGGCSKLCPQLEEPKKYWQVIMNPRTNECSQ